jgi:hypothetical protein
MNKFLAVIVSIFGAMSVHAQTLPDSIKVMKRTYVRVGLFSTNETDSVFSIEIYSFHRIGDQYVSGEREASKKLINQLQKFAVDTSFRTNALNNYGIDTDWIKQHPAEILASSPKKTYFRWNDAQKALIFKELTTIGNYKSALEEYIQEGCCYSMHQFYRKDFTIGFYLKEKLIGQLTSRKFNWGFAFPWTDQHGQQHFDARIDNALAKLLDSKRPPKLLKGKVLLQRLAKRIVEINERDLYKLAPRSYEKEISELRAEFRILSTDDLYGYGGYWGNGGLIQVILHNDQLPAGVNIEFLASQNNNTIYSRDSVISKYKDAVDRVRSIRFLMDHLAAHPKESLNILFFDNRTINDYNIDAVNTNPAQWKRHDDYVKSLNWYKERNVKPSFDINKSIKVSESNDCGCNLRLQSDLINKSIMFIIYEAGEYSSRWLLLPDNTVLEFSTEVGKLQLSGQDNGPVDHCLLFDLDGRLLTR